MKRVFASAGLVELEGWVEDDADLGEVFTLTEDDGTKLRIKGWLFSVEHVTDDGC